MAVLEVEGAVGTDAGGVALAVVAALPHELLVGAQQVVGDELGELAARPVLAAAAASATDGMSGALVGRRRARGSGAARCWGCRRKPRRAAGAGRRPRHRREWSESWCVPFETRTGGVHSPPVEQCDRQTDYDPQTRQRPGGGDRVERRATDGARARRGPADRGTSRQPVARAGGVRLGPPAPMVDSTGSRSIVDHGHRPVARRSSAVDACRTGRPRLTRGRDRRAATVAPGTPASRRRRSLIADHATCAGAVGSTAGRRTGDDGCTGRRTTRSASGTGTRCRWQACLGPDGRARRHREHGSIDVSRTTESPASARPCGVDAGGRDLRRRRRGQRPVDNL